MLNLEPICASYGHGMIVTESSDKSAPKTSEQENTITKALGILVESGLYAMCIFLVSCNKKDYGQMILKKHLRPMWQEKGIDLMDPSVGEEAGDILIAVRKITEDFPKLVLARRITEQALTFARYHAKAEVTS